jgi:hypothetical protein
VIPAGVTETPRHALGGSSVGVVGGPMLPHESAYSFGVHLLVQVSPSHPSQLTVSDTQPHPAPLGFVQSTTACPSPQAPTPASSSDAGCLHDAPLMAPDVALVLARPQPATTRRMKATATRFIVASRSRAEV